MYPDNRTKFLTIAVVLALFGLIAILTSGCVPTPEVKEELSRQAEQQEQEQPSAETAVTAPAWAQIDHAGSWERMYDSETGVVCYSRDGVDQQSCFYLGG